MDQVDKNMIAYCPSARLYQVGGGEISLSQCVW
jgi:hypothetical protein